ncbi:actin depolymerizing protein [Linderina pennispora]|uniref:Actin depolymerizing protein n=1 Tax=Linderina pennispora TaxID=61395 RepID=A0A1Y1W684_9FUNG|nr:actin depolymerizing protein [Linderina pennispora]ORX68922.1 actin depolymerizing protein [Linderina pennispora]
MGLCDNPEIAEAYENVRDDKSETNWLLLEFVDDRKDELKVGGTGTGGLDELKTHLKDDQAAFGYVRMIMSNDELSQRTKFVFISWCGVGTRVMRKAKLSVQKGDVKNVLRSFSIEVPASELGELANDEIMLLLRKAGGANYDRQASNY